MKLNHSEYTISELIDMLARKDLVVNTSYQRGSGIWPEYAKTYFIDSILEGYPFPKVYLYQSFDDKKSKSLKEIVDGQQRITTIVAFRNDEFSLTGASKRFDGKTFSDLPDEVQRDFLLSTVQADVILAAERSQLLEMFRRINSYTVPLNEAEKRHSEFQGLFKWFVNDLADELSPVLEEYHVFTPKQILRMADAEFFSELVLVLDSGITHRTSRLLKDLYRRYDKEFPTRDRYGMIIREFFTELTLPLASLRDTFMMKPYVLHSLFTAMVHLKYGIPNGLELLDTSPRGVFYNDVKKVLAGLQQIASAHETQDVAGVYRDYVQACLSTTTKASQRTTRTQTIIGILQQ